MGEQGGLCAEVSLSEQGEIDPLCAEVSPIIHREAYTHCYTRVVGRLYPGSREAVPTYKERLGGIYPGIHTLGKRGINPGIPHLRVRNSD